MHSDIVVAIGGCVPGAGDREVLRELIISQGLQGADYTIPCFVRHDIEALKILELRRRSRDLTIIAK